MGGTGSFEKMVALRCVSAPTSCGEGVAVVDVGVAKVPVPPLTAPPSPLIVLSISARFTRAAAKEEARLSISSLP